MAIVISTNRGQPVLCRTIPVHGNGVEPRGDITSSSPCWQLTCRIKKNDTGYDFNCSRNLSTTMLTISPHSVIAPTPISTEKMGCKCTYATAFVALTDITTCEVLPNRPDNVVSYDLTYDAKVLGSERVFVHESIHRRE